MRRAEIKIHDKPAGWLSQDEEGYHFVYDTSYLRLSGAEPVSLTLPLQEAGFNSKML